MEASLKHYSEKQAELARKIVTFSGIDLLHIKRQVAELINCIGKAGGLHP